MILKEYSEHGIFDDVVLFVTSLPFFVGSFNLIGGHNLADKKMFCIFASVNKAELETYR